jgi:GntR family transcriptional repressor for pyruvate dehydrogenase complex
MIALPPHGRGRGSRASEIAETLRDQIASGALARGERLPTERELAAQFGVSQPTVREALRVLDVMGMVSVQHGRGTFVTANTQQSINQSLQTMLQLEDVGIAEILEVRRDIHLLAVRLAVQRATPEEIELIERTEAAFDAPTADRRVGADRMLAFIAAIADAAHNPLLAALERYIARLLVEFELHAFEDQPDSFWRDEIELMSDARKGIIAALVARDVTMAADAVEHHHSKMASRILRDASVAQIRMSDRDLNIALRQIAL